MPHFGILCPPATGHIQPMGALGRSLIARGHRVTMFQLPDLEAKTRSEDLEFRPVGEHDFPVGTLPGVLATMGKSTGIAGVRFSVECGARLAAMICREAPSEVKKAGIELLIVDQNEPAAGTVAEHLHLPFVSICTSLPINRERDIPPPFVSWQYRPNLSGRFRNYLGLWIADRFLSPITDTLNRFRWDWRLPPLRSPNDSFSRWAQISQTVAEIDFPRKNLPPTFHYAGPFCRKEREIIPFPFDRLDQRPMIYAALGTLQNRQADYFRRIAEACAPMPAQLVISLGNSPVSLTDMPGNPLVVAYAPQLELLSRAALTITHGGTNTTLGSLSYGVPMVAIPITTDQPGTAARIAYAGAGEMLALSEFTTRRLRAVIERVLRENHYRAAAQKIRAAIEKTGGVERAADIIEQVARTNEPVTRSSSSAN